MYIQTNLIDLLPHLHHPVKLPPRYLYLYFLITISYNVNLFYSTIPSCIVQGIHFLFHILFCKGSTKWLWMVAFFFSE